jgi:polyisoprenoid-binding protein YceI
MEPADDPPDTVDPSPSPWRRRALWIALGVVGLVAVVYGAIFFYANVINDSPDALDSGDLTAALADPAPADTEPTATEPVATEPTAAEPVGTDADAGPVATQSPGPETSAAGGAATSAPPDPAPAGLDGTWTPTPSSEFGYRVEEVLAGVNTTAVGRSNEIDGELVVAGTEAQVDVAVEVATITSDDSRRDGQFRGRIMDTDTFPEATFRTTEPIRLDTVPAPGEQVTATATGELTLKGTTNTVTFDVTAEVTDGRIGVLGSIPVRFEDYGIDNPSFGAVRTEDDGLVEFVLVFEPA